MLICTHFANTSIVVENEGDILGLISGYILPDSPEVFFVWQVAVHRSMRGQGLALRMLTNLMKREGLKSTHFIETTISPDNLASQNLFKRFASDTQTPISNQPLFDKTLFGEDAHEDEDLYRIGPLKNNL